MAYADWYEGDPESDDFWKRKPSLRDPGIKAKGPAWTEGTQSTDDPPPTGTPTQKPTTRFPTDQRPPSPDPNATWNDDWWDGKSPYLGGWLIPNTNPRTDTGYGGKGGGGTGEDFDYTSFSDWPSYESPDYIRPEWIDTPNFDPGPAFTYADFAAPDPSEVGKDPAFQFRFDQGLKALSANRAGAGTFLSGATGKALQDYGQKSASQEYDNIWNRSLQSYDTNRGNAFQNWAAQYGQRKDAYGFLSDKNNAHNSFNLSDANSHNSFNQSNRQFDFSGKQQQALAKFNDLFNRWKATGDWTRDIFVGGAD